MRLRSDLFKPPTYAKDRPRERHATWLELFYDLVFVAAISQLAFNLDTDYTGLGVLRFVLLFIPVWWAWVGQTFYLTRFDSDDIGQRLLTMVQIIAVAFMAVNISDALGTTSIGFALSYATIRFLLVIEYIRAAVYIPEVRPLINRYIAGFGAAAILWVVSALFPPPYRFLIWVIALVVDLIAPLTAGELHAKFPPHLMHLPERFGLFTIIVLGEAVLSAITGIETSGLTIASGATGIMGLIIASTLWWGYFEGARATLRLQTRKDVQRYQEWLYSHLPLFMSIAITAIGIKHIIPLGFLESLPMEETWILSTSIGVSTFALTTIFLSSFPTVPTAVTLRFLSPHYIVAFITIGTGTLGRLLPAIVILGILTSLRVVQNILSLRIQPANNEDRT